MLRSKLVSSSRSSLSSTLVRTFASTTPRCHMPASSGPGLGDITPETTEQFKQAQKEFREQQKAAKRAKEQAERMSRQSQHDTSTSAQQNISHEAHRTDSNTAIASQHDAAASSPLGLGSLSISAGDQRAAETDTTTRKGGRLSDLIYGTAEGQRMDQDMERSFSQLLARGKYVHTIVHHKVKPEKSQEYIDLISKWYPYVAQKPDNKVNLVGSWRTEIGECDTFVHIWEYQRYLGYHESLNHIRHDPKYAEFDEHLKQLLVGKTVSLMQEFSFWPTTPPRKLGGVFELRSYTLHPGNLLEWETHWRKGLKARREVMEGVGAWFVQIGDLNTVHHLWQFANLEERRLNREQSWGVEGWADTVHKTVPLIQKMESKIMVPMPWSPVA